MELTLLVAAFISTLVGRLDAPYVVTAQHELVQWVIPVEIDGKPLRFLIDDRLDTAVSKPVAIRLGLNMDEEHKVSVLGHELAHVKLSNNVLEAGKVPFDGILGIDVLNFLAIGFDYAQSKVALWPLGAEAEEARNWVCSGRLRPGFVGRPTAWQAPIRSDARGVVMADMSWKGNPIAVRLTITGSDPFLPKKILTGANYCSMGEQPGYGEVVGTYDLQFGAVSAGILAIAGDKPPDEFDPDEPCLSVDALGSERIIVDFQNGLLYEQTLNDEASQFVFLSKVLGLPLYTSNKELKVGPLVEFANIGDAPSGLREGETVLSFRGVPAKELLKILMLGKNFSFKDLKALLSLVKGKPRVVTVLRDGKPHDIALLP